MRRLLFALVLAAALWTLMFSPLTAPHVDFWWTMTGSALLLSVLASLFRPGWWRGLRWTPAQIVAGAGVAVALWAVFWTGDKVAAWLFDFARPQVAAIYGMKDGAPAWRLTLQLLLLIGPAEEIFWRGYVQRTLSDRWGADRGYLAATLLYAAVHIGALNFMLFMAALVCGIVWGGLYRFFPRWFPAIILSHALWDVAVFVWFPI